MRKRLVQALVPLIGAGFFLLLLAILGRTARDWLRQDRRSTIGFTDIDCPSPPACDRIAFLGEVQYLGRLPDRLSLYEGDWPPRLFEAFVLHPWVERVEEVRILKPDRIRVRLVFRLPVLAVPQPEGVRVVDGRAILLPSTAPAQGLPALHQPVASPQGIAGTTWGDPVVEAAAATLAFLKPHQDLLALTGCRMEAGDLVLETAGAGILWGQAPGAEKTREAAAADKLKRLLDHCRRHGRLDQPRPTRFDVRSLMDFEDKKRK
jgi:hypothetical protein